MNIQHTAYLVAHLYTDPTGRMRPQVHAVRIYSEGATSLSYVAKDTVMVPQRYGCHNGTTAHPPVRRWHSGWDRMWGEIAKAYGDAACVHDGEAWQ